MTSEYDQYMTETGLIAPKKLKGRNLMIRYPMLFMLIGVCAANVDYEVSPYPLEDASEPFLNRIVGPVSCQDSWVIFATDSSRPTTG